MSLSVSDLKSIRVIVRDEAHTVVHGEVRGIVREEFAPVESKIATLENDIKEIYFMLRDMQSNSIAS